MKYLLDCRNSLINYSGFKECRLKAQITVFAALSIMLVMSVLSVCLKSASQAGMYADIDMAAGLSVESVFAGYSNKLLSEFDIFAVKADDSGDFSAESLLDYYAKSNIEGICDSNEVKYISSKLEDMVYMTDESGIGLESQAVAYMKYAIAEDFLKGIAGIEEECEKAEKVQQITNEIIECEEQIFRADSVILELIQYVEGIRTNSGGLVIRNGKAVATGEYFVKALLSEDVSPKETAVDSKHVYTALTTAGSRYVNADKLIKDMLENVELYQESGDEYCLERYALNYNYLFDAVQKVLSKTKQAISTLEEYKTASADCGKSVASCIDMVNKNKDFLDTEVYDNLMLDLEELKSSNQSDVKSLCDVETVRIGLNQKQTALMGLKQKLEVVSEELSSENCDKVNQGLNECLKSIAALDNTKLKFDYSMIDFSASGEGKGVIDRLKSTLEDGICALVLGEDNVSDKSINYTNLACDAIGSSASYSGVIDFDTTTGMSLVTDTLLFNEYLIKKFNSYIDGTQDWCELSYPLEYIICGNASDKENINQIILELSVIREGANMAYIITDSEKKKEAAAFATTLVGFTGNMAVVKAVEYLILAVWAYGESICDIQALFRGENVPLIKTKKTWQLSLSNLLSQNFSSENDSEGNVSNNKNNGDNLLKGELSYEDYLRILLMMKDPVDKRYRAMSAMELRMIYLGNPEFRMKDYIWISTAVITVKLSGRKEFYTKEVVYSYV